MPGIPPSSHPVGADVGEQLAEDAGDVEVLGPAEAPAKGPGLYYMDTSSAAAECVTLMAAAGYAQVDAPRRERALGGSGPDSLDGGTGTMLVSRGDAVMPDDGGYICDDGPAATAVISTAKFQRFMFAFAPSSINRFTTARRPSS